MNMRCAIAAVLIVTAVAPAASTQLNPYRVRGDTIEASLTGRAGNPDRGRALVADRQRSLCLLCHTGPFPDTHMQGTLAPDLRGAGSRLSAGQLRLRLVDMKRVNPAAIMPSYYRIDGLTRVAEAWSDKPVLTASEIEDIVAYLQALEGQ